MRKICQQPARVLSFLFGCGLHACTEILIIRDFEARAYSQPPPHTRHQMRAQTEAPTSEAAHCSGPALGLRPGEDSGRWDPSGPEHLSLFSLLQPRAKSHPHPPPRHILSLLPYRLCKMSKNSGAIRVNAKDALTQQRPLHLLQPEGRVVQNCFLGAGPLPLGTVHYQKEFSTEIAFLVVSLEQRTKA